MDYALGLFGLIVGLFLWSNIFGSLFGTLPLERKMVKAGVLKKIAWVKIIGPILLAAIVIVITAVFAKFFFIGTIVGGFIMLFNISKLRAEAEDNFFSQSESSRNKATKSN